MVLSYAYRLHTHIDLYYMDKIITRWKETKPKGIMFGPNT
jgi:hypothetical protein